LDAVFEAYLSAQRRRRRSPLTVKATVHALTSAQRWLDGNGIPASELSLLECERYFDELLDRCAVSTVRRHLAYLRAAYAYALRHGLVPSDPTAEVRLPRLPDHDPVIYSSEQLRSIHAAIRSAREELVFHLFAFAGLRLGEAAALTWDRVDVEQAQLRLVGKGGKHRLVPLHPVLNQLLRRRARPGTGTVLTTIQRTALSPVTLGRDVRALTDRAGVSVDAPSHAFRRTVATQMYEHGVRERVLERIMGWAPRTMHERHYLRVCDQPMRDAINTLYRDDPICDHSPTGPPKPTPAPQTRTWLADETACLAALERQIGLPTT
jgi:site-specific recombinase XerD